MEMTARIGTDAALACVGTHVSDAGDSGRLLKGSPICGALASDQEQ
jgi:hypothetical protein